MPGLSSLHGMRIEFDSNYFLEGPGQADPKNVEHVNLRRLEISQRGKRDRQKSWEEFIIPGLFHSLHSEVVSSQSCIVNLQDELGIPNAGRNDLATQAETHKMQSYFANALQVGFTYCHRTICL